MGRVEDILTRARNTLSDHDKTRWSDARLISLVDEAQKDICRHGKILRGRLILTYFAGQSIYNLPEEVTTVDKVLLNGRKIPMISHDDLDSYDPEWETRVGDVQYCVYDKRNRTYIRLWPATVDNLDDIDGTVIPNSDYGFTVSIDGYVSNQDYGLITDIEYYDESVENTIVVYYLKKPADVTDSYRILSVDDTYDNAIKYYVVGKALRDDIDAQNRAAGAEELAFYDRELREIIKDDSTDFTRNSSSKYRNDYIGFI